MVEFIGYTAGVLFALCGAPLAYHAFKMGKSYEPLSFLYMWFIAEILMTIYVLETVGFDGPLFLNYTFNIIFIMIVLKYKHFPREV
jgi:hypothetical protein